MVGGGGGVRAVPIATQVSRDHMVGRGGGGCPKATQASRALDTAPPLTHNFKKHFKINKYFNS
jgi:hypothetical protein